MKNIAGEQKRAREGEEEEEEQERGGGVKEKKGGVVWFPLDCWALVVKFCEGEAAARIMRLCSDIYTQIDWKRVLKRIGWRPRLGVAGHPSYSSLCLQLQCREDPDHPIEKGPEIPRFATTVKCVDPYDTWWTVVNTPGCIEMFETFEIPFIFEWRAGRSLFWERICRGDTTVKHFSLLFGVDFGANTQFYKAQPPPGTHLEYFHVLETLRIVSTSRFLVPLTSFVVPEKMSSSVHTLKFTRMDLEGIEKLVDPKQVKKLKLRSCLIPQKTLDLFTEAKISIAYEEDLIFWQCDPFASVKPWEIDWCTARIFSENTKKQLTLPK